VGDRRTPPAQPLRPWWGRRRWERREVLDAIFYVLRAGCPWRFLPDSFPPSRTVYRWFGELRDTGGLEDLNHHLVQMDRVRAGRESMPSAAVIASQSVKITEARGPNGYDAGKKIKGRKLHAMVDTDGLALELLLHNRSTIWSAAFIGRITSLSHRKFLSDRGRLIDRAGRSHKARSVCGRKGLPLRLIQRQQTSAMQQDHAQQMQAISRKVRLHLSG